MKLSSGDADQLLNYSNYEPFLYDFTVKMNRNVFYSEKFLGGINTSSGKRIIFTRIWGIAKMIYYDAKLCLFCNILFLNEN